jgi:hypothetical protein
MTLPLTLTVHAAGATEDDLITALDEVKRLISEGFSSGFGSNETGSFDLRYADTAWQQHSPPNLPSPIPQSPR